MGVPGCALGGIWPDSIEPGDCGVQPARNCPCGGPGGCMLGEVWPEWRGRREKMEGREQICGFSDVEESAAGSGKRWSGVKWPKSTERIEREDGRNRVKGFWVLTMSKTQTLHTFFLFF